jgi:peroxiredoxin Q/BCP
MTHLKEGDIAPDFKAKNQQGKEIRLTDLKGKKVILYFYPKDDTPGCTTEACNLRDNYHELLDRGFVVLGVSPDTERSHTRFIKKFGLQFNLLADTGTEIIKTYGVWGLKNLFGREYEGVLRTTFVIDEEGKIEKIIDNVDNENHTRQILDSLMLN